MLNKYVKCPNLSEQLHEPDSWTEGQGILLDMLELAKDINLIFPRGFYEGMDNLSQAMNESLVLLGWQNYENIELPILGYQSIVHSGFNWTQDSIYDLCQKAVNKIYTSEEYVHNAPIDMDIHHRDPFIRNPYHEQANIIMGEITKIIVPVDEWKSYKRQWMDYQEYLKTDYWQNRRYGIIDKYNERCALCNKRYFLDLHIHHRTYVRRGHEFDSDLIALCPDCHSVFHKRLEVSND